MLIMLKFGSDKRKRNYYPATSTEKKTSCINNVVFTYVCLQVINVFFSQTDRLEINYLKKKRDSNKINPYRLYVYNTDYMIILLMPPNTDTFPSFFARDENGKLDIVCV